MRVCVSACKGSAQRHSLERLTARMQWATRLPQPALAFDTQRARAHTLPYLHCAPLLVH